MLDAVSVAIERDRARRLELSAANEALKAAASLTPREHEVMEAVVKGLLNKQIAHLLDISEVTVKIHRGNVMRKMNVASLADLVRKAGVLNSLT
jgi:FixJ family two-component response regulator